MWAKDKVPRVVRKIKAPIQTLLAHIPGRKHISVRLSIYSATPFIDAIYIFCIYIHMYYSHTYCRRRSWCTFSWQWRPPSCERRSLRRYTIIYYLICGIHVYLHIWWYTPCGVVGWWALLICLGNHVEGCCGVLDVIYLVLLWLMVKRVGIRLLNKCFPNQNMKKRTYNNRSKINTNLPTFFKLSLNILNIRLDLSWYVTIPISCFSWTKSRNLLINTMG